jgi:putative PIN family toxin of toxin-antitoxin system
VRIEALPRAVVDTNLLISGFFSRRSAPFLLLQAWQEGKFIGLISPPLRAEYDDVLKRPALADRFQLTAEEIRDFFVAIDSTSEHIDLIEGSNFALRDPNDEMVLATAVSGNADLLVTGDRDLLDVADDARLGRLRIVTAAAFVAELGEVAS